MIRLISISRHIWLEWCKETVTIVSEDIQSRLMPCEIRSYKKILKKQMYNFMWGAHQSR